MATGTETLATRSGCSSPIATTVCGTRDPTPVTSEEAPPLEGAEVTSDPDSESDGEGEAFGDTVLQFHDGSRWAIQTRMSSTKLQLNCSPCEAKQVFTAVCTKDPLKRYRDSEIGIIKIRLQVQASLDTMLHYQDCIKQCKEDLARFPAESAETKEELKHMRAQFRHCKKPTKEPNPDTTNELMALQHLYDSECSSAPWLISFVEEIVQPGMHIIGVEGGYAIFILMTKVPGKPLNYDMLCTMTAEERAEIRGAFKKALTDVRDTGIIPTDTNLSNIVWDAQERKCYIVDFEHCELPSDDDEDRLPSFHESDYKCWGLDEKFYQAL